MIGDKCVVAGKTYFRVLAENTTTTDCCDGCIATIGTTFCKSLGRCVDEYGTEYVWVSQMYKSNAVLNKSAYDICMAEHYKYLQYDTVEMDDFERGCIGGRKLQSEKLARMIKNG